MVRKVRRGPGREKRDGGWAMIPATKGKQSGQAYNNRVTEMGCGLEVGPHATEQETVQKM